MEHPLSGDTLLARFQASRELKAESPVVKPSVFSPRRETDGRLALSTFRLDQLSPSGVKALGESWVRDHLPAGRRLKSCVALPTRVFERVGLRPDADDRPPRHVNVVDWPDDESDRLDIVNELCAAAEQAPSQIARY